MLSTKKKYQKDAPFVGYMTVSCSLSTREVSTCTTVHPIYTGETVLWWQKGNDGQSQRIPVPRPTAVAEYINYMRGWTPLPDIEKTERWPMTVFQHLLDIAVTNTFIVHKEFSSTVPEGHDTPGFPEGAERAPNRYAADRPTSSSHSRPLPYPNPQK